MKQALTPAKLISLITKEVFRKIESNFEHEVIEGNSNLKVNKKYSMATAINCYVIEKLVNYEGFEDELNMVTDLPRSAFMAQVKKTSKLISEDVVKKIIVHNIINNVVNTAQVNDKYSPFLKSNPVI